MEARNGDFWKLWCYWWHILPFSRTKQTESVLSTGTECSMDNELQLNSAFYNCTHVQWTCTSLWYVFSSILWTELIGNHFLLKLKHIYVDTAWNSTYGCRLVYNHFLSLCYRPDIYPSCQIWKISIYIRIYKITTQPWWFIYLKSVWALSLLSAYYGRLYYCGVSWAY